MNKKFLSSSFDYKDFISTISIDISEVSKYTGVSTRQLRYWEEKGYINSINHKKGKNRRYTIPTVYIISILKTLIDKGLSVKKAVEKVQIYKYKFLEVKKFIFERYKFCKEQENTVYIFLGKSDDNHYIYGYRQKQEKEYSIMITDEPILKKE